MLLQPQSKLKLALTLFKEEIMKQSFKTALAVLAFVAAACGGSAAPATTDTVAPAATTAPTAAPTEAPTNTPEPTVDLTATTDAENAAAAAEWAAYISPDLKLAGYTLAIGDLAWIQTQQLDLVSHTPGYKYNDMDPTFTAANFVMGIDVTWDSTTGLAGCGIIFRAQGNVEKGEEAMFAALRLSGFPGWDIELWKLGQIQANLVGKVQTSSVIDQGAGSTNHYVISADGTTVIVYANGLRLGAADLKASMTEGLFGFVVFEESGTTTCTFTNTWIWALP
jgi:hypothetical protein